MARLGLLGVDLLAVDDVLLGGADLVDRFRGGEHDEGESSGAAGLWVCLNIDAFDLTELAKMISQLLYKYK